MHRQSETRAGNHVTPGAAATCPSAAGVPATACSPPQALGPVGVVCVRACVLTSLPLHHQAYTRCSGLVRPRAPALQCLDVFLGAGELPRCLVFSLCVRWDGTCCARGGCRAGLRLLHCWHAVWFDVCVVSSLAACTAPRLGGCFLAPRAVWLACVGRLAFLVRVCL